MDGMASVAGVAAAASLVGVWCFARIGYQRWRAGSERALLAATELHDSRSAAESWMAAREPLVLTVLGTCALAVALVSGFLALID
jgi:hypothetical protein